jgi:hypothetical protein
MTTKTKRPTLRPADLVTLASHVRSFPAYDGKPAILRDTVLRVSSIQGKGTNRAPWKVTLTDGMHFWHVNADDVAPAEVVS